MFSLVHLVNKDQLDILATLRESVDEDKASLEADVARLKEQLKELSDKNRMQLEQVNALLLEKVGLQSEGIGQRERMLQREREFGWVPLFGSRHTLRLTSVRIQRSAHVVEWQRFARGCQVSAVESPRTERQSQRAAEDRSREVA
jgi:hypothetical protein